MTGGRGTARCVAVLCGISKSLPQQAQPAVQGKVVSAKNACIVLPKPEEVVLLKAGCKAATVQGERPLLSFAAQMPPFPEARQRRRGKAFLRKYRTIKVVDWRVHFSSDAPANFAGLLGSSARKTLQWRVFSENGLTSPGGKSRNLQDAAGGKGTAKRTAVLCGISLSVIHAGNHWK